MIKKLKNLRKMFKMNNLKQKSEGFGQERVFNQKVRCFKNKQCEGFGLVIV